MDGIAVAERIRRDPGRRMLRSIMNSAVGLSEWGRALARARHRGLSDEASQTFRAARRHVHDHRRASRGDNAAAFTAYRRDRATPGASILLAEDNEVNQLLASRVLEKLGHRVTVVANGHEALAALSRAHIDLVLLDVQMPVMGGLETAAAIRAREADSTRRIPIVALTANAMDGDRDRCLAVGMDDHLSKPFTATELETVLGRWLPANPVAISDSMGRARKLQGPRRRRR